LRDRVGCGPGRHDEAAVDEFDVVRRSCELVGMSTAK
jgi:hypothetical protein